MMHGTPRATSTTYGVDGDRLPKRIWSTWRGLANHPIPLALCGVMRFVPFLFKHGYLGPQINERQKHIASLFAILLGYWIQTTLGTSLFSSFPCQGVLDSRGEVYPPFPFAEREKKKEPLQFLPLSRVLDSLIHAMLAVYVPVFVGGKQDSFATGCSTWPQ